jgi:hypothetical protein
MTDQYTVVYTDAGTVAHLLGVGESPNDTGTEALCGRSAWPGYWFGTGSQEEYEKAEDMRKCIACLSVVRHQRGGT